jgi:hypothetical protein
MNHLRMRPDHGVVAIVTAAALTVAAVTPAAASTDSVTSTVRNLPESTMSISDPAGDAADPRGDVVAASVTTAPNGTITFTLTVAQYSDPSTWGSEDVAFWWVDADNVDPPEAFVGLNNEGAFAMPNDLAGEVCLATTSLDPGSRTYRVRTEAACIGNPAMFHWYGGMAFGGPVDDPNIDFIPDEDRPLAGPVINKAWVNTFRPLSPARLLDTRPSGVTADGAFARGGLRPAGSVLTLQVAGRGGVPRGANAAVLNVTATEAAAQGYVTAYPCNAPRPTASNLNFVPGRSTPNLVVSKLDSSGRVCLYTHQVTHLVVDTAGAFPSPAGYRALTPARLADSRPDGRTVDGNDVGMGLIPPNTWVQIQVTGRGGVPVGASAAVLNLTATQATGRGFLSISPCSTDEVGTSALNITPDRTVANLAMARLSEEGLVCLYANRQTHVIIDVMGSYTYPTGFAPLEPARVLDTRPTGSTFDGQSAGGGLLRAGRTIELTLSDRAVSPTATTAVLNVTATEAQGNGFLTVYPCDAGRPLASNLNVTPGPSIANQVVTKIGSSGTVCIYSHVSTHVVADIVGAF